MLYNRLSFSGPLITLSQSTDNLHSRLVSFGGIEVKQSNGSEDEARLQLALWLSAGLRKVKGLRNASQGPCTAHKEDSAREFESAETHDDLADQSEIPPALGWTIKGDEWKLYMAWFNNDSSDEIVSHLPQSPSFLLNFRSTLTIFVIDFLWSFEIVCV